MRQWKAQSDIDPTGEMPWLGRWLSQVEACSLLSKISPDVGNLTGKKTITNENKTPRQIVVPWTKSKQYLKNNNNNQTKKQKQKKTKNQILGNGINHAHDKSVFVNYAFLSSSTSWKSPKIPQTCHIQSTIPPPPPHTHTHTTTHPICLLSGSGVEAGTSAPHYGFYHLLLSIPSPHSLCSTVRTHPLSLLFPSHFLLSLRISHHPGTHHNPPASISPVLGSQVSAIMSGRILFLNSWYHHLKVLFSSSHSSSQPTTHHSKCRLKYREEHVWLS